MLKSAALLCPIAYLSHMTTPIGQVAAKAFIGEIMSSLLGIPEFNPKEPVVADILTGLCKQSGFNCYDLFTSLTGKNCCLNSSTVELYLKFEPQPTSTKNMVHLAQTQGSFARTSGTQFVKVYLNGFNAYWLMLKVVDPSEWEKATSVFQKASSCPMNVARTWAFNDGGYRSVQYKPGSYNEDMFKGLDFVISEARNHGIFLILSLINNYENFGGRKQYVEWAKELGEHLISEDDFYKNPVVKNY